MACSIIFLADVDVQLEGLSLQEVHVEAVNFIDERELCLVVRSQTFTHLSGLSAVIVEVNRDHRDKLTLDLFLSQLNARYD